MICYRAMPLSSYRTFLFRCLLTKVFLLLGFTSNSLNICFFFLVLQSEIIFFLFFSSIWLWILFSFHHQRSNDRLVALIKFRCNVEKSFCFHFLFRFLISVSVLWKYLFNLRFSENVGDFLLSLDQLFATEITVIKGK